MSGSATVVVYADERTPLQSDRTLQRVSSDLNGVESKVLVVRRNDLPCTLVTITWVAPEDMLDV
jgi:hypothetical protein